MRKKPQIAIDRKEAKRTQAQEQVKRAYEQCQEFYDDIGTPIRGTIIDGKVEKWRIRMEPEIEDLYSTLDIVKALDIPRERLRDWMNRGFVKPSLPASGQGTIAIFTYADVLGVALFEKLIEKGFKRENAAEYIDLISGQRMEGGLSYILITSTIRDGERHTEPEFIHSPRKFGLEIDEEGNLKGTLGLIKSVTNDWDDIQLMNIRKLKKEVSAKLNELA